MKNNPNIKITRAELKKVQHVERLSQETQCFVAEVWFDGKKLGTVSNEGHGGCDDIDPTTEKILTEYALTLPPLAPEFKGLENDASLLVGYLLEQHLVEKDLKKALSKKFLFVKDGSLFEARKTKDVRFLDEQARLYTSKGYQVLNVLDFPEALELYRQYA